MILIDCHQSIRQDGPGPTHPSFYLSKYKFYISEGGRKGGREGGREGLQCSGIPTLQVGTSLCAYVSMII